MDQGGAAKCAKLSTGAGAAGEDRLSALPDDVLVLILLRLRTPESVRTSVLSRRWRRVSALLPELRFSSSPEPHGFRDALAASAVPLRHLFVGGLRDAPAAARRVSGELILVDKIPGWRRAKDDGGEAGEAARALELPCFGKAISILLDLGFLGLSLPPAGVFARLTELSLRGVQFHAPCDVGGAISTPRCPCLQKLTVQDALGLDSVAIQSDSLKLVELDKLRGLRQLTITAQVLQELSVVYCLYCDQTQQPIVNISAPQLKVLNWTDAYGPSSVHIGKMEHLQSLRTIFFVYGVHSLTLNHACLMFMSRVKVIKSLTLVLGYLQEVNKYEYLMEDMTVLPDITSLHLILTARRHAFGACSFHILRMCPGIKRLRMDLSYCIILEAQAECPQGCICGQPSNWKTEELMLNCLHEVEIHEFRGSEHELVFVMRLFTWATSLKRVEVTFNHSVSKSIAKDVSRTLRYISRPEICMKFYVVGGAYAPED